MHQVQRTDSQRPISVAQSQRPVILLVEDNSQEAKATINALVRVGYDVMHADKSWTAALLLKNHTFAFVLVDGGLEDGCREEHGLAARLIREGLNGVPYGRLTNHPELMPEGYKGLFCLCKKTDLTTLVNSLAAAVPLPSALKGQASLKAFSLSPRAARPLRGIVAVVAPEGQLEAVDGWLRDNRVAVLMKSAAKNWLLVPEFDLPQETAQELNAAFEVQILSSEEYFASQVADRRPPRM